MSVSAVRHVEAVGVTRFAWQRGTDEPPGSAADVRLLLAEDPDAHQRRHETLDLVLPSVIDQRAEAAEREGYDRGLREGERAGEESVRVRSDAQIARLSATIDEIASLRSTMVQQSEQDIVRLAIAIAERILQAETRADPRVLEQMARAAARKLGGTRVATILLNPDDFAAVASARAGSPDDGPVRLAADASIAAGSCVVQSAFGNIDVGYDAQIRELSRSLLGDGRDASDPGIDGVFA